MLTGATLEHVVKERGMKMKKKPELTTEAGAAVADNQHSQTAVSRPDVVERSIAHFRNADPDYGRRLTEALTPVYARR